MNLPPLSLYVHLPWCVQKCPYCDFNSHTAGDAAPTKRYIEALLGDLAHEVSRAAGREITSVFLGGGTPSLFSPTEIQQILDGVRILFHLADDVEITMEANPGALECGSPAGYREAGVNRLSIGAQSFDDGMLSALGRIHKSDDILRGIEDARNAGFENINIDLMHGLPGQTPEQAMGDLQHAVDLGPTHISWYQLTLEPNTVFHARAPKNMPDEERAFEIQERGRALLATTGYQQYEISAYARDGLVCRHNMNYWTFGDYLAVGAGGHGKITTPETQYRYQKPANPLQYMITVERGPVTAAANRIPRGDLIFEFMLNALRLKAGFSERLFLQRTGLSAADLVAATRSARQRGLIERYSDQHWQPTDLGERFLNDLQSEFMPDTA